MYVIIRYNTAQDVEKIMELVETREDMIHYQNVLLQKDPSLKKNSSIFDESINGRCVPIATNSEYSYYSQYQKVVKEPSFSSGR